MANLKENKKYHFTYKTTNLINGRYYLGMHSTNKLNDGYVGSGKRLYYELSKYGKENFKFEILEHFNSREELVQAEVALITEEDLKNSNCLNCKPGGTGGWTEEVREKAKKSAEIFMKERWKDQEYRDRMIIIRNLPERLEQHRIKVSDTLRKYYKENKGTFTGKEHTEETKKKISETNKQKAKGSRNSQYGTCWITDGEVNKKIKTTEPLPEGWKLGRKCK